MKSFNLEEAKAGKPICTGKGKKARIICTDLKSDEYQVVAAVSNLTLRCEEVRTYTSKDKKYNDKEFH